MTVRDKAGLRVEFNRLIDSGGAPLVTAADLRSVLGDIVDSLALQATIPVQRTNAQLVAAITAGLGNSAWQLPPGQVSGITLAQAIAAVIVDGTTANSIKLTRNATLTEVTIGIERVTVDSYYFGWNTIGIIMPADFAAATASDDGTGNLPAELGNRRIWFGVPHETAVTGVFVGGGQDNQLQHYVQQIGTVNDADGDPHDVYVTQDDQVGLLFGGAEFEIQHA